jgi:transposase
VQNTGYSENWIGTIARRYNADGPDGIGDRRHANPGAASLLSTEQLAELDSLLDGPAPDGGLWTGPKVATWMSDKLGRRVHVQRGWELLQRLNYRAYVPRPQHAKADAAAQEAFQKNAS